MGKRYLPAVSVSTYGAIFLLLGMIMAGALVRLAMDRVEQLRVESHSRYEELARKEIQFTLGQIIAKARELGTRFSEWDELSQQYANSTYYEYWRTHRAPAARFVPAYFDTIELYTRAGVPLAQKTATGMPKHVSKADLGVRLKRKEEHYHLYYVTPVQNSKGSTQILGYMALALDFHQALGSLQKFRYADVDSIELNSPTENPLRLDTVIPNIKFSLLPNPELDRFRDVMITTLGQFGLLAAVLGTALMYFLATLGSRPLRLLSQHIDKLSEEGHGEAAVAPAQTFRLSEFEKIRLSLNDYQKRLEEQRRALRDREARVRSLLENVPDSIIILNGEAAIELCNPAAEELFGYTSDSARGMTFESLFHSHHHAECREYIASFYAGGKPDTKAQPIELLGQHSGGRTFHADITLNKVDHDEERLFIAVARDISERKRAEERLRYMANYDVLTGLPNRTLFRDRLEHAVLGADREGSCVGLIFLDLDQFKRINDTLGHHIGDQLLMQTAQRLTGSLRNGDTVARQGGDEFTVLVEGLDQPEQTASVARKILSAFAHPFMLDGQDVVVTPSLGIATYPVDGTAIEHLLKNADAAMYRAKELGGNRFQFFTAEINARLQERLTLESELRRALEQEEFRLAYQPRVESGTNQVIAVEALLRWEHPVRGTVLPGEFIPVLEETGLIREAGEWVLREACRQVRRWQTLGFTGLRVAVNVSAVQFRHTDLVREVLTIVEEAGIPPDALELEITEGLLIEDVEGAERVLSRLSAAGIHISIDDFGTGYSSLHYLKRFPIDTLKIDKSFVRDVTTNPDDAAIVELIISMARTLGMNTAAEGVETAGQLEFLQAKGCREIQGFLLSKPLSPDLLERWMGHRGLPSQETTHTGAPAPL